jgi:NAD(P)-dependent dehydrogenase (short-subunit alcohol dehydrogenase family)
MKIVLADISLESLTKTAGDLEAMGAETLIVQTDVSLLADVENLAEQSFEALGAVHLLVNNAGVSAPGTVLESSMDDWNWQMGVNFYGVLHGVRAFIPRMIEQDTTSHVVNVSSTAGLSPGGNPYSISKKAVIALTEGLYHELAEKAPNLKVSVYCPGWVNTDLDTCDRSRPERFQNNVTLPTDEGRVKWREAMEMGMSIEEAARVFFEGLQKDNLYIGPKAFQDQWRLRWPPPLPGFVDVVRDHTENILNEYNPEPRPPSGIVRLGKLWAGNAGGTLNVTPRSFRGRTKE